MRERDWKKMSDSDRLVLKDLFNKVVEEFSGYLSIIEQWEKFYGKIGNNLNLQ